MRQSPLDRGRGDWDSKRRHAPRDGWSAPTPAASALHRMTSIGDAPPARPAGAQASQPVRWSAWRSAADHGPRVRSRLVARRAIAGQDWTSPSARAVRRHDLSLGAVSARTTSPLCAAATGPSQQRPVVNDPRRPPGRCARWWAILAARFVEGPGGRASPQLTGPARLSSSLLRAAGDPPDLQASSACTCGRPRSSTGRCR